MSFRAFCRFAPSAIAVLSLSCSATLEGEGESPGGTTAGLDGAWDITAAGRGSIGPAEMTIGGGVVEGFIPSRREGIESFDGCKIVKDRAEFKLSFEGNALSGTISEVREYEGAGCSSGSRGETTPISGTRRDAGSGLSGEWEVTVGRSAPFIVVVDGLTAKAWDKEDKLDGREAALNAAVAGGSATVTAEDRDFTFAARRR